MRGRAWLDHEWSESLLPEAAVGWDWIGMNLADGGALTAFSPAARRRQRRVGRRQSPLTQRCRDARFGDDDVRFDAAGALEQQRHPRPLPGASGAWTHPPAASRSARCSTTQELDSRRSTGTVYWEGLTELLGSDSRRLGRGYLEMTGYALPLRL